jgi:branched-chain amino acid transport system permease protein
MPMSVSMYIENFLQLTIAGLTVGCVYGLMCVGLAFIFGIMRVINFAQGDYMMVGMYIAFFIVQFLVQGNSAEAFWWTLGAGAVAAVALYAFGAVTYTVILSKAAGTHALKTEDAGHTPQLLLTLGLSVILMNLALMFFTSNPRTILNPYSGISWQVPLWGDAVLFVNQARTFAAILCVAIAIGVGFVLKRTSLGRRLRAAADNPVAATYLGINVDGTHRIAFGLGVAITAIAGIATATYSAFNPFTGLDYVVIMYAGVILGGMGTIFGAFLGGLTIGLIQQLSTMVLPIQVQMTAIFGVLLVILLVKPQGLFGRNLDRA